MSQKTKGYKLREESGQRNSKVMCPSMGDKMASAALSKWI